MLGSFFMSYLAGLVDFEMYAFSRDELDLTNHSALDEVFKRISPDFVINCSAYTAVDDCEENSDLAFEVNATIPGLLASFCARENAVFVHFSTDYVFDGKSEAGYMEIDSPCPLNVYGESKLEGERLIQKNMTDYYIIRTSWLYGPNGKNFVNTMIELAKTNSSLDIVSDQIGAPTYTKDLVETVVRYFLSPFLVDVEKQHEYFYDNLVDGSVVKLPFGIYHVSNSGSCSWYDFASRIFELMSNDLTLNPVSSSKFPRPAERPAFSILLNTKLGKLRHWSDALEEFISLNFPKKVC